MFDRGSPFTSAGPVVTEPLRVGGWTFLVTRPGDPDRLLDDPRVQAASRADDYMPYWAYLWPGAWLLAEAILAERWPSGWAALELGCGLGLSGLAGLAAGLAVTFSDYDPDALGFAARNARQNGFSAFRTERIDWRRPPDQRYPLILGADVLYEVRLHRMVLGAIGALLTEDGVCWIGDPDRTAAEAFPALLEPAGFVGDRVPSRATGPDGRTVAGSILKIRRAAVKTGRNQESSGAGRHGPSG